MRTCSVESDGYGGVVSTTTPRRLRKVLSNTMSLDDCLIWQGSKRPDGYGRIQVGGRDVRVHRWVYEQVVGPIGNGLLLRHRCHRKACINVEHLVPGTHADNTADQIAAGVQVANEACRKGHRYTPETTHINSNGYRSCLICRNETRRKNGW